MPYIIDCPSHCGAVPYHRDFCPGCFNQWAQEQRRTAVVQHNLRDGRVVQELCCSVHGVVGRPDALCEQCVAEWRATPESPAWSARPMTGQEILHWYAYDAEDASVQYDEDGVRHATFHDGDDVYYYKIYPLDTPPVTPP